MNNPASNTHPAFPSISMLLIVSSIKCVMSTTKPQLQSTLWGTNCTPVGAQLRLALEGMYKLYPPLRQFRVALPHPVDVLLDVRGISQYADNVFDDKPPFILMNRLPDLATTKCRDPRLLNQVCLFSLSHA